MKTLANPYRGHGLSGAPVADAPYPSTDAGRVRALLNRCPRASETPLVQAGIEDIDLWVKDERGRMGLGSFKALGAAYVIAHLAQEGDVTGQTFVTASAGNHGMSVAAGAAAFGAKAEVHIAETVPESFAERLRDQGARVVRSGADYAASMAAAEAAARDNGWTLLSDSSWGGYMDLPWRLMEGYTAMAAEMIEQMSEAPDHIYLQAGVGGLAGACAACFRAAWGDAPVITVVEPEAAPALFEAIKAGRLVDTDGPDSHMGRLDCKTASAIALRGLSRDADRFCLISEAEGADVLPLLAKAGLETTGSGAAGVAAALLDRPEGRVLCILSEAA